MVIRTLEADVETRYELAIIDLRGEISSRAEDSLFNAYEQAKGQHSKTILFDLEDVEYINSAGIALIIRLVADAREQGCSIAMSGLNDHYMEIFHITRLDDYVALYANKDSALQAFGIRFDE